MARRARMFTPNRKGEDSYFVSLNDLLIGMLFVFIILLMIFALTYQSAEAKLNQQVERLQDELSGREDLRKKLLIRIQEELRKVEVPAEIDEKNGVLHLPETVLFASGSADLGTRGQTALTSLARTLSRELPCYGHQSGREDRECSDETDSILEAVYVEGHTDNVPINTARYANNWELSSARAIRTYQFMVGVSGDLEKMRNAAGNATMFGVSAYADRRSITPDANSTVEGRAKNRRIDIRFLISPPTRGDLTPEKGVGSLLEKL